MRRIVALAATLLAFARGAAAYPAGSQFDLDPVDSDGAGGVVFTGAPRWAGHTCDTCHTNPPRRIGAELDANPVELFTRGYTPGTVYRLRVVLTGEWAGLDVAGFGDDCGPQTDPYQACDDNGFALEIDDASGQPTGRLAASAADGSCAGAAAIQPDAYISSDGSAAIQSGFHHAVTAWSLCWTAPQAGAGALTAFVAVVDGNGGAGVDNPNDVTGDDVFAGAVPLIEEGSPPRPADHGGCAVAAGARAGTGLAVLVLVLCACLARRRWLAVVLAVGLLGGCATVKPWEREKLAKRKMKFGADPAETELDLHMQNSRESSEGGYGSAGGGCGCN